MRRFRRAPERDQTKLPVMLNARGETLAAWIRAYLDRARVTYQFEPLPRDDYQFRVSKEDKAVLKAAAQDAHRAKDLLSADAPTQASEDGDE